MKWNRAGRAGAALCVLAGASASGIEAEKTSQVLVEEIHLTELAAFNPNGLSYGFLIESEGSYERGDGESGGDLVLATAEFAVEGQITTNLSFHVGLLWEEDDTEENNLDEAFISLGGTDVMPFYLNAGKFYLPFGRFESAFISDPLTLELAEINKSAVLVGYSNDLFNLSASAFSGSSSGKSTISDGVLALDVTPIEALTFGIYWISDLMETDSQVEVLVLPDRVAGAGGYLSLMLGSFMLNAEVISALDTVTEIDACPLIGHLEAAYSISDDWLAALRYECSDDFADFAEEQFGGVVSYALNSCCTLSGEYLHADYDDAEADLFTIQLALEL